MSVETTATAIPAAEQNIEVQQDLLQSSNEESVGEMEDVDEPQDNVEDGTESSCSAAAVDTSDEAVVADEGTRPPSSLQDIVAIGASMQDSRKSLFLGGGNDIKSQQGGETDGGSNSELQQGGETDGGSNSELQQGDSISGMESQKGDATDGTESQQGVATGGTESQKRSATGGTESQQESATGGTESQQESATGGTESQQRGATGSTESQQSGATRGTEFQQDGATGGPESQQGGPNGDVRRQLSLKSASSVDNNCAESLQRCGSFTSSKFPCISGASEENSHGSSSTGDSQETAVVGDSYSQLSLENEVAGCVFNSLDSPESPANGTEFWGGMIPPLFPLNVRSVSSYRLLTRGPRINEYARAGEQSSCAFVCDPLIPCSKCIRKSRVLKYIKSILMFIQLITFFLGMANLSSCPVRKELPILMALLGLTGFFLLTLGLKVDPRSMFYPNVNRCRWRVLIVTTCLLFLGLFGAVLYFTYTMTPSFDPGFQENRCDYTLYSFAYRTNFLIAGIVVMALFLYFPTVYENIAYYEHF